MASTSASPSSSSGAGAAKAPSPPPPGASGHTPSKMERRMSHFKEYKFFRSFSAKVENWPMRKAEQLWRKMRERKIAVRLSLSWQYFTKLTDLVLTNSKPVEIVQHSEYIYGDCKRDDIRFYTTTHINHVDILGKVIVRGWIDVPRIPTCIRLQGRSYIEDTFRSTAFNFQFCVPRMSFIHSQNRWLFYFYEWYIPLEYEGGMNYDIYFFGPSRKWW